MLKINKYYQTEADLENAEEPYKSVATILDKLYLEGLNNEKALSADFKNTLAISCIRYIAEDLSKRQASYVSRLKELWKSIKNPLMQYGDYYEKYSVPYDSHRGVIFGGVYYALSKQEAVNETCLDTIEKLVSGKKEAVPYFNYFKNQLIGDIRPFMPRPSLKNKDKSINMLRKEFIQGINTNPKNVKSIDWADATIGFDKEVMTEIFWGIDDDDTLEIVVDDIIETWNRLSEVKDSRCFEKGIEGSFLASISPLKFGSAFKQSINKFFADLRVERNARNTYAKYGSETVPKAKKENISAGVKKNSGKENAPQSVPQPTDSEVKNLKVQLNKSIEENRQLREYIESLENGIEAFKERENNGKEKLSFTVKEVAIFLKAILLEHNSLTNNTKSLSPLLQRFGGWTENTSKNALGYKVTQAECDKLGSTFDMYAPVIANMIKSFPEKYKEEKENRLQNNLKNNC